MKHKSLARIASAALLATSLMAGAASASTVVINNDEWTLSDTGFASTPTSTAQFVANLVAEFGTQLHAFSSNFGLTQSSLASAMTAAGATYTTSSAAAFSLGASSGYNALFFGGDYLTAGQLTDLSAYVAGGGNVYIAGGTGAGGPAAEASAWNAFLAPFGVQMASVYNGISGNISVSGDPLFAGVSTLFQNNGNGLSGSSVVCCGTSGGLYAVHRTDLAPVPLPAGGLLLLGGLTGLAAFRRRRHTL